MDTHHSSLEFWRLAIEYICGLDPVLGNSDSAIEKPHQMAALGARAYQTEGPLGGEGENVIRTSLSRQHHSSASPHLSGARQ